MGKQGEIEQLKRDVKDLKDSKTREEWIAAFKMKLAYYVDEDNDDMSSNDLAEYILDTTRPL